MKSQPGRLHGSGIRPLPDELRERILAAAQDKTGRRLRLYSARYRVTGFRDPGSGAWIQRNPRNGQYYARFGPGLSGGARHRTQVRPTLARLRRAGKVAVEVELDRGGGPHIYYTTVRF